MNIKIIGGFVLGAALGAGAGYWYASKRLEANYEELAKEEIEHAKIYYKKLNKVDEFSTATNAATHLNVEAIKEDVEQELKKEDLRASGTIIMGARYGQVPKQQPTTTMTSRKRKKTPQVVNVFDQAQDDGFTPEWRAEMAERSTDTPYIVSVAEHMENEYSYTQCTLTWYIMDGVLADENDDEIEDLEASVGRKNLNRFGHMSEDPKVVYVRNERQEIDYEILLHGASYAEVVAGFVSAQNRKGSHSKE